MAAASFQHQDEEVPDWMSAKYGIKLLINNRGEEAQAFFARKPDSLPMFAGYSYAAFMEALMSLEEDKLNVATSVLKDVEKKCSVDTGWLKSVKKAFGNTEHGSLADSLETQIILADSQVCLAILIFMQQDISGFFKGAWVLRKAWKVYQSVYTDILTLYNEVVGESNRKKPPEAVLDTASNLSPQASSVALGPNGYKIPPSHSAILTPHQPPIKHSRFDSSFLKKSFSVNSALSKHANSNSDWATTFNSLSLAYITSTLHLFSTDKVRKADIDKSTVERLMGAVSFGYGLFQLGLSLLPPSLLKLTSFLGFTGNRQTGISCLMYAREGIDMRAPLATLALLWYHTIVRPFYALDGSNVVAGVDAATQLLEESESEYGQSALFLFFKGRVYRLKSDIPNALASFNKAVDNASQREIKNLSMHEVGWCHLIKLDFCNAQRTFIYLKSWSRWSRTFYCYLAGVCWGACQHSTNHTLIKEFKAAQTGANRTNQLDEFLARRARCCPSEDEDILKLPKIFWKLLVYELLYLWNALPSCSPMDIEAIRRDCEQVFASENVVEPMVGLSKLILGACYCIQNKFPNGATSFRLCLELRKDVPNSAWDAHISAFAHYELGTILLKFPETKAEGKELLQNVSYFKDFDFEQRLNVRVHSILKQLN